MIVGIGTDIIEVERIAGVFAEYGDAFARRIFTEQERAYCESFAIDKMPHYAARFAVKEAFSKAIGTGITNGFKFKDIGIINEPGGKPSIVLQGEMLERWGSYTIHVSISHTTSNAIAVVIIEDNAQSSIDITIASGEIA